MGDRRNDPRSLLMIVVTMLIFGSVGVFRRHIPIPSAFLAFSRGVLGGLFILAFTRLARGGRTERPSAWQLLWLVATGAAIGANWILLFEAYNHTTVAIATLCYYMQPTIVVLLSPLFFREPLTARKATCAAVAVVGMVLVSGVVGGSGAQGTSARGVLLGLGAALLYSAVGIANKKIEGVDAYLRTTVQLLSAGVVMVPHLLLTGGFEVGDVAAPTVLLLLVVGIVHTGIAYLMYFKGMEGLRMQTIAIASYIDPVSALLFSAVFLGEPLSTLGIVGAVMIIGSAIFSELQAKDQPRRPISGRQARG